MNIVGPIRNINEPKKLGEYDYGYDFNMPCDLKFASPSGRRTASLNLRPVA